MLELENFGVVEMNSQEIMEVDGGIIPLLLAYGLCWAAGFAVGYYISCN